MDPRQPQPGYPQPAQPQYPQPAQPQPQPGYPPSRPVHPDYFYDEDDSGGMRRGAKLAILIIVVVLIAGGAVAALALTGGKSAGASISGTAYFDKKPLANQEIRVGRVRKDARDPSCHENDEPPDWVWCNPEWSTTTQTDSSGAFTATSLEEGRYELHINLVTPDGRECSRTVFTNVAAGQAVRRDISFRCQEAPGGGLVGVPA